MQSESKEVALQEVVVQYPGQIYPDYKRVYSAHHGDESGILSEIDFMARIRNGNSITVGNVCFVPGSLHIKNSPMQYMRVAYMTPQMAYMHVKKWIASATHPSHLASIRQYFFYMDFSELDGALRKDIELKKKQLSEQLLFVPYTGGSAAFADAHGIILYSSKIAALKKSVWLLTQHNVISDVVMTADKRHVIVCAVGELSKLG